MFDEPTITWRVSLPLDTLEVGPALTPQLREIEERIGVTRDVLWAYAEAMPQLLGPAIMEDVQPLGFGRGSLVAIATETPVHLPHLQFVQTASEDVCRIMGSYVPQFHVKGQACLEALLAHGSAVKRVWVRDCPPYEVDAPFEVIFVKIGGEPFAWHIRWGNDHLLRIAALDEEVWLCWDRDDRRPTIDIRHLAFGGTFGPRDVAPEKHPPPWAPPEAFAYGGSGWAASVLIRGDRSIDEVCVCPDRRWILMHSFPAYPVHDAVLEAWREKRPMRPFIEGTKAFAMCAELELHGDKATFRWVGSHRVLRLRHGRCEQLTRDHSLQWHYASTGETITPEVEAALKQYTNIVAAALATHDLEERHCDVLPGDRFVLLSSAAHEKLLEQAAEDLAARLSQGSVHQAARWAARALRDDDGHVRYPVALIDADATVTVEAWYDKPIRIHCATDESSGWQLLEGAGSKPWIWPKRWSRGIREQMACGRLLSETPREGDILRLLDHGNFAFQWRDGAWHDVFVDLSTFKVRAMGSLSIVDNQLPALPDPSSGVERVAMLEKAGCMIEAYWLRYRMLAADDLTYAFGRWIDKTTKDKLLRLSDVCTPSVRDLVEHPRRFHGRRIRTRGVLHVKPDRVIFADARFEGASTFPLGAWLVEVEGEWFCNDKQTGENRHTPTLVGAAQKVSLEDPRPITAERIQFARPYVPLVAEVQIDREARGWKFKNRWLVPLSPSGPLPKPEEPDSRHIRMIFARDAFHVLGLFSYTFLDEPTRNDSMLGGSQ